MTRVQTYAHTRFVRDLGDDIAQIFKCRPDHVARACHVLQHGLDTLGAAMRPIQRVRYAADGLVSRVRAGGARTAEGIQRCGVYTCLEHSLEIVEANSQHLTPFQVFHETVVRLPRLVRLLLRQVDQVRTVGNDVSGYTASTMDCPRHRLGAAYLAASYLCSLQSALNSSAASGCNEGFSHLRWDFRKTANALPLESCESQ